jgi:hypothetical protein
MMTLGLTITFLREFGAGLWVAFPMLLTLALLIALLGQLVGKVEGGRDLMASTGRS